MLFEEKDKMPDVVSGEQVPVPAPEQVPAPAESLDMREILGNNKIKDLDALQDPRMIKATEEIVSPEYDPSVWSNVTFDPPVATGIEKLVCEDIAKRQHHGFVKYGVTVADNPLEIHQWLQHLYEELLDAAVYIKRSQTEIGKSVDTESLKDGSDPDSKHTIARYSGQLLDCEEFATGSKPFTVRVEPGHLAVGFPDCGLCGVDAGYGEIVAFDYFDGKLHLLVWGDINDEDATHIISLDGALESKRKPQA